MARIQPLDVNNAPEASRPMLEGVQKKMGMVPNLLGTLAQAPAALSSYLALGDSLGGGNLTAAERERLALAIGEANGCEYCVSAHSLLGKGAGLDANEIDLARRGTSGDPRQAALARFGRILAEQRGIVSNEELEAFRAAGWSDGDALEVVAIVALNTLTNYANHLAGTEVDFPRAAPLAPAGSTV